MEKKGKPGARSLGFCFIRAMPAKPPTFRMPSQPSLQQQRQAHDRKRLRQQRWRNWYKLAIWCHPIHGLRALQLQRQPWCATCAKVGRHTPATVVHHREDHKGIWSLFIDPSNHESACKPCHDGELQQQRTKATRPA
jgi:5-methylcytosine-specific restriction protein A